MRRKKTSIANNCYPDEVEENNKSDSPGIEKTNVQSNENNNNSLQPVLASYPVHSTLGQQQASSQSEADLLRLNKRLASVNETAEIENVNEADDRIYFRKSIASLLGGGYQAMNRRNDSYFADDSYDYHHRRNPLGRPKSASVSVPSLWRSSEISDHPFADYLKSATPRGDGKNFYGTQNAV